MSTVELTRDERAVRRTSGPVLGMVVFVASEAMFFATFFGAYFTIYSVNPVWPPAGFPRLEPELATVLTVVLVGSSVTLLVDNGDLVLGRWQGVYFCEFDGPRLRTVLVQVVAGRLDS